MAVSEAEYAAIGRFVTEIASAESVIGKLWWHQSFSTVGITLETEKLQGASMTAKLSGLRKLVARGSRLDLQVGKMEAAYDRVANTRHTLVHGFTNEAGTDPVAINLRNEFRVAICDVPLLLPWAKYLCCLAIQAHQDATRGIYDAEQDMLPLQPIVEPPEV